MELRHLRYFVAVAEELNFGRAAAKLHIAQPPLSVQIQALERELGVRLFSRSSRQISLTKEGEVFLGEARELLDHSERIQLIVHQAAIGMRGTLNIAGVSSAFHIILPRLIRRFRESYPQVAMGLTEMDTADALDALHHRTVDVALVRAEHGNEELHVKQLLKGELTLAVPVDHPLASVGAVELASLADEVFLTSKRATSPDYYDQTLMLLRSAGFTPRVAFQGASIQSIVSFVACGLGVALVPASARFLLVPGVRFLPLAVPVTITEISAVWLASSEKSAVIANFLELVDEFIESTAAANALSLPERA